MKMVVGLGNPGKRYELTRHNIGFIAIDYFSDALGVKIERNKYRALIAEAHFQGEKIILVKPQTYMNLSGDAVGPLCDYYKINPQDIIVLHDDMDIELGKIRIRPGGGTGGHKGISSLVNILKTKDFNRLRIGIGRPPEGISPVDYVLGKFNADEIKVINELLPEIKNAVEDFLIEENIDKVMSRYNSRQGR